MSVQGKKSALDVVIYCVLGISGLLCVLPLVHTIAVSFSSRAAAGAGLVYFWPVDVSVAPYEQIVGDTVFLRTTLVSLYRVIVGGALQMAITILLAFPLSRSWKQYRPRNVVMWVLVFAMLFRGGLIPTYMVVARLGLIDNYLSLILPQAVNIFNVVLLMNFFRNMETAIEEAAIIDGLDAYGLLVRIFIPLSVPALATIGLFTIVGLWNQFFDGLIYMGSVSRMPLQSYIFLLSADLTTLNIENPDELARRLEVSSRNFNAAKIVVAMVPIVIVYPFLQRFFVTGIQLGSVKG